MLEEYSDFRIATIIVSLLGILILFFLVKKDNLTIGDYFVWLSLLISIVFLSLFPSSLVYLTGFISLSFNERYDRLIIISYIFVFFLITLIFYYRLKINMLRYAFVETMQLNEIHKFLGNSKKNKKELMIAVPAYNEENTVIKILEKAPSLVSVNSLLLVPLVTAGKVCPAFWFKDQSNCCNKPVEPNPHIAKGGITLVASVGHPSQYCVLKLYQ